MRPSDVLAHKRLMYDWAKENLAQFDALDESARTEDSDEFGDLLRNAVDIAALGDAYYVSSDMTAVASAAAKTMPPHPLSIQDLPSDAGFLLYDRPVGTWTGGMDGADRAPTPVVGFMWTLRPMVAYWGVAPGREGGRVEGPPDGDDHDPPDGHTQDVDVYPLGRWEHPPYLVPLMAVGWTMSWTIGADCTNDDDDLSPVLRSTWLLMQQSLSMSTRSSVDRPERRRCFRTGLAAEVLIVRLRRKSLDSEVEDDEPGEQEVPWSHRWLVNGHWRQQACGSGFALRRPTWIASHVKGPDHKPLVIKDRVTAWVR